MVAITIYLARAMRVCPLLREIPLEGCLRELPCPFPAAKWLVFIGGVWSLGDTLVATTSTGTQFLPISAPHEGANIVKERKARTKENNILKHTLSAQLVEGGLWRDEQGGLARGVCKAT